MQIKVIYLDNTAGLVNAASLDELIVSGKIVAFKNDGEWVEVRRRNKGDHYKGPERRKSNQAILTTESKDEFVSS